MARNKSFTSYVNQIAREQSKREREKIRFQRESEREALRVQREAIRELAQTQKEMKQQYLEMRTSDVEKDNHNISKTFNELDGILESALDINHKITLQELLRNEDFPEFILPADLELIPSPPNLESFLMKINKPNSISKFIPGTKKRYEEEVVKANNLYNESIKIYENNLADREGKILLLKQQYDKDKNDFKTEVMNYNKEILEFNHLYRVGDPNTVSVYCNLVLEKSEYPENFPKEYRLAYVPDSKELVIDYELPYLDVIPKIQEYRYIKTKDSIEEKPRKQSEIKVKYQDVVSSLCLRTIYEIFNADQNDHINLISFNGFVQTVDPSTGRDIKPYLISVRTSKEKFQSINLRRVEKRACLRNLGAQISPQPDAMIPVKPVVEFDMVDKRFVEESDILSDLENRPNLMDLNPFEFENFITNLFSQIGFQTKLTRSSKDGGVDAIAFDPRPILGGKVVIQAKRYKNVVGVSAVRDLYGTMINEGASKGILVTTSHYGPDAYDFAKDKPIELIDGGGLLYLLDQQGIKAKIIMPEEETFW
jgi:restriction system protein